MCACGVWRYPFSPVFQHAMQITTQMEDRPKPSQLSTLNDSSLSNSCLNFTAWPPVPNQGPSRQLDPRPWGIDRFQGSLQGCQRPRGVVQKHEVAVITIDITKLGKHWTLMDFVHSLYIPAIYAMFLLKCTQHGLAWAAPLTIPGGSAEDLVPALLRRNPRFLGIGIQWHFFQHLKAVFLITGILQNGMTWHNKTWPEMTSQTMLLQRCAKYVWRQYGC